MKQKSKCAFLYLQLCPLHRLGDLITVQEEVQPQLSYSFSISNQGPRVRQQQTPRAEEEYQTPPSESELNGTVNKVRGSLGISPYGVGAINEMATAHDSETD